MKNFFLISIIFLAGVSFARAEAPSLYFESPESALAPDSEFVTSLFLRSDNPINALAVSLSYSSDVLELISINTGSSIIDVWANYPKVNASDTVSLEGGVSSAFQGQKGEIISLTFRMKKAGTAQVSVTKAHVYYADGLGTLVEVKHPLVFVEASEGGARFALLLEEDTQKPEFKDVSLEENPIEKTPIVVFEVSDVGSGIKETQFRYRTGFLWSEWASARTPVRLAKETWVFQIKAIDNLGNVAVYTEYLDESAKITHFSLLLLAFLAIFGVGIMFLRRRF